MLVWSKTGSISKRMKELWEYIFSSKSLLLYATLLISVSSQDCRNGHLDGVSDVAAVPDFRSVMLKWKYLCDDEPEGFFVTLCERSFFKRSSDYCFERHLLNGKRFAYATHDSLATNGRGRYEAVLHDLRMLTNYTAFVEPMNIKNFLPPTEQDAKLRSTLHQISGKSSFTTKGFSAHATNCQFNSSDIVVHSGPYFGGKIAVEGSRDPRCSIGGNRTSSKEVYILRINHQLCRSTVVNDTRIDTVVVVHESNSVVTHNSRRFLIQCNFLPETFTIKASFSVPPASDGNKRNFNFKQLEEILKNVDSNDVFTYEEYRQNNVKDSRLSSVQENSFLHKNLPGYESQMLSLLVIVIVMVIVLVLVVGLGLWWYVSYYRRRCSNIDIETLSTSNSSIVSYHYGGKSDDDALIVNQTNAPGPFGSSCECCDPKEFKAFNSGDVALISLKPFKGTP